MISPTAIRGSVIFDLGLKHMTLQVPLAASVTNNGSSLSGGSGHSSRRAGKSLVKTKVDSYFGLVCPLGLVTLMEIQNRDTIIFMSKWESSILLPHYKIFFPAHVFVF